MSAPGSPGLGWGIVGYGWVARDFAAPAMRHAGHRVAAIVDPSPAARAAAHADGIAVHETLSGMLADPAVDAVYVATPNHRHREPAVAALRAGRPVLCEKPMAATLADAEAIADAARATGTPYGTAFDQRHHPAHAVLRDAVRGGRIGTVTAIRIVYACWLGRDWSATGGAENWRADPAAAGGGALMDLAPHGLDLAAFLLDEPIADVTALLQRRVHDYPVDDGAMLLGSTAGGALLSLHVAYNHPESLPRRRLEIVGTGGLLTATDTMGQEPGGTVRFQEARTAEIVTLAVPDAEASPFTRQMRAFGEAVRGVGRERFDAARDLHTMRLLDRAYAAARGRTQDRIRDPETVSASSLMLPEIA
ncbi:Gfo/Idh/MocA family protein [Rhizosaccharibacter radicis]|uniref:Gfo/Idh/MocA family oxidoreductase n=1 Tax=Rhizosaccharibacter radicis TaxID=2782605 RepID=A0ABT1VUZ3_9PROT|nr:Gfo/Idh/MocA family oxidoreductase [Acetobacteraceae bacterium KSS12]